MVSELRDCKKGLKIAKFRNFNFLSTFHGKNSLKTSSQRKVKRMKVVENLISFPTHFSNLILDQPRGVGVSLKEKGKKHAFRVTAEGPHWTIIY